MSKVQDYYKVLEISKDATQDQIKKAYKKLAIKWHPDKNPGNIKEAEEKFKVIAEAYSVLSDEKSRKQYDMYGSAKPENYSYSNNANFSNSGFKDFGFQDSFFSGGFTFERAEQMFREAFGEDFDMGFGKRQGFQSNGQSQRNQRDIFEDRDSFFSNNSSKMGSMMKDFGFGGFGSFGGFENDFFKGGFGNMGGISMNMNTNMSTNMGGFGGTSKSVSTSTIIRNGKKVTVTKTTTINSDGTAHTEVTESTDDGNGRTTENRYLNNGQYGGYGKDTKSLGYGNY